jgi:hypothetical protein
VSTPMTKSCRNHTTDEDSSMGDESEGFTEEGDAIREVLIIEA